MTASETGETEASASETGGAGVTEASATEASVTEASATEASATEASVTEASATDTSATEASATEASATEASATDTSATDTSATEATDSGDTDTGGPAECEDVDPAVKIEYGFAFAAWTEQELENHEIDTTCVVGEISAEGGVVTTQLSCELDGVPQPASLRVSADALDQDYAAGEQVQVVSETHDVSEIDYGVLSRLTMRSLVDGRLLVAAMRNENLVPETFAPLVVEDVQACGNEVRFEITPLQVQVTAPEGPSVGVIHGHRGVLELGDGFAYTIEVVEASMGNCCHFDPWHHLLMRRVQQ